MRCSLVLALCAALVVAVAGCPSGVDVPDRADAGPQKPDGGPGEGEGEGEEGEGEEGEGEGIIIVEGEGEEGEGEGEGEPPPLPPGSNPRSITVGGDERTLELVVPEAIRDGVPLPLVVVLHGNDDTGANFAGYLGVAGVADVSDAVFAVLDGVPQNFDFNPDFPLYWDAYSDTADNDDIKFIDGVIDALVATGGVNDDSVHVFGFSQGGFMAYRYALERSTLLGSVVVVSAGDPFNDDHLVEASGLRTAMPFKFRIGGDDPLLTVAQATNQKVQNAGFETSITVVAGIGDAQVDGFPVAAGTEIDDAVRDLVIFQLANPLR